MGTNWWNSRTSAQQMHAVRRTTRSHTRCGGWPRNTEQKLPRWDTHRTSARRPAEYGGARRGYPGAKRVARPELAVAACPAFAAVCGKLGLADRSDPATLIVAKRSALAQRGVTDPDTLRRMGSSRSSSSGAYRRSCVIPACALASSAEGPTRWAIGHGGLDTCERRPLGCSLSQSRRGTSSYLRSSLSEPPNTWIKRWSLNASEPFRKGPTQRRHKTQGPFQGYTARGLFGVATCPSQAVPGVSSKRHFAAQRWCCLMTLGLIPRRKT